jgi:hypothetical protein
MMDKPLRLLGCRIRMPSLYAAIRKVRFMRCCSVVLQLKALSKGLPHTFNYAVGEQKYCASRAGAERRGNDEKVQL